MGVEFMFKTTEIRQPTNDISLHRIKSFSRLKVALKVMTKENESFPFNFINKCYFKISPGQLP